MDKKFKQYLLLIAFGAAIFAGITNLSLVINGVLSVIYIISPVLIGFLIAFILNVPMKGYEKILKKLTAKNKKPPKDKLIQFFSMLLALISVLLILFLVFWLVIPTVIDSLVSLYNLAVKQLPGWIKWLKSYGINTELITQWLEKLNLEQLITKISSNASSVITWAVSFASTAVSGVSSFAMSFVLAIYVLLCKKDLSRQINKLATAHLKPQVKEFIFHVGNLINDTYSKFLSGQCVEACILGLLIFIAFSIFKIPYAGLTGVLTTVFAFIPFVGAFLSCFIGAFLVLIAAPSKVLLAIIVYLVVQFIENQFIYPHVVGNSVGLSSLWTLVAVVLGESLFGILGMIFFIPIMAVLITLIKEYTEAVMKRKNIPITNGEQNEDIANVSPKEKGKDE